MEKVVVVMSTYNGEKYVGKQIETIVNQTGVEVVLYIRDDGSTDDTVSVINEYKQLYSDKIILHVGENIGWRRSFMEALVDAPQGDYYAFADQDDIWLENKLKDAVDCLKQSSNLLLYICNAWIGDRDCKIQALHTSQDLDMAERSIEQLMLNPQMPGGLTYVFDKELKSKLLILKNVEQYGHDTLTLELALSFGDIYYDKRPHVIYRQHDSNVFGSNNRKGIIKNRINLILGNKNTILDLYGMILSAFDRSEFKSESYEFIRDMFNAKKNMFYKLKCMKKYDFRRENLESSLSFYCKFLIGKV